MSKNQKNAIIFIVIAVVLVVGYIYLNKEQRAPGQLDSFAQCLKDKGAIFYGAFWCPHCQNEKGFFGSSARLLPYVECSTPDGNAQLPVCIQKKIQSYPTWEFSDGTRETGEVSLETLAEKTGCVLPK